MKIEFEFDEKKAVQTIAYIVSGMGKRGIQKIVLMKLLYLADKEHFLNHGHPITGDDQYALPRGPLPSKCLNIVNADKWGENDIFKYLHIENNTITIKKSPGESRLSEKEKTTLDAIISLCKNWKHSKSIVDATHDLPEYVEAYVEGTSRPIPYDLILKYSDNTGHFRRNKPVISREMRKYLKCPFPSEPDEQ